MKITKLKSGFQTSMLLNYITIYGVNKRPAFVKVNGENFDNFIFNQVNNVGFIVFKLKILLIIFIFKLFHF